VKIVNIKPGLIIDVIEYLDIEIINKNRLRCPFHDDSNPSAILSLEANTFKCFACGIILTSKQFFKKYLEENLGYSEEAAEEKWQKFLSFILNSETANKNKSKNDKNKSKKVSYINIADKLWNLIANCSVKSPYDIEVIEYLKKRKLPRQLLSDKIISILPLLDEKVLSKIDPEFKNYYKFLTAAHKKGYKIAIPQKDESGKIINIQLRNVDRSIKPKTISLKNHKTGNFILEPKDSSSHEEKNKIIITEGSIDFLQAITISNFKHYVYGLYSATAKADPLINFIKNKNINKIILIPHKDSEGIRMKNEITKELKKAHENKEIKIEKIITIDIKNYKDLAELIESKEEERKNISKAIDQA